MRTSGLIRPNFKEAIRRFEELDREFGDNLCSFLREAHPEKTSVNVQAATGISAKTVDNWLSGVAAPRAVHFVRLFLTYGPEFLCACLRDTAPAWLTEAGQASASAHLDAQIAALEALKRKRNAA